jgi:hypothetical protein
MRRLANDLELQIPVQRLSSESQCSTDSFLSYGNVASSLPIFSHSFDRQPTKEMLLNVEKTIAKSETVIIRSLNSMDGNSEPPAQRMAVE